MRQACWIWAAVACLLALAAQWVTVTANYGGHWTALFCTGAQQSHPPLVTAENVYLFPHSLGFDGQFYHYVAHDPWLRTDLQSYIDDPGLRYRRILVPLLAYTLALGQQTWIDQAYELVVLLSVGLGVYWSARFAEGNGLPSAWGLLFLCVPAVPVSLDRLVVDATLAALTIAFLYESRSPSWRLFLILVGAALTRETGLLLIAACCLYLLVARREFRTAGVFSLSAVPALAWYACVQSRAVSASQPYEISFVPLAGIVHALLHPGRNYPGTTPYLAGIVSADILALAGLLMAFGLAICWCFKRLSPSDPVQLTALAFTAAGILLQRADYWQNVYDFGRVYTPLLLCLAARAAQTRNPWLLAPIAMMAPRLAIQITPQMVGIVRWLSHE